MENFLTSEQKEQIDRARVFMPWANAIVTVWDPVSRSKSKLPPMTDEEIWGVLAICRRKSLNPADTTQVSVVRDKNGIRVTPGYRVMINWLNSLGRHSTVTYVRLVGKALADEGVLDERDLVYRASVVMLDEVADFIRAGVSAQDAINLATHTGVGRVSASDYLDNSGNKEKAYAAPNGRTPADKAKKRAFMDLVSDMGGPTDDEFHAIANMVRGSMLEDRHFEGTQALSYDDARAMAVSRAQLENPITNDDSREIAAAALFGEVDTVIIDEEPQDNPPEPEAPTETGTPEMVIDQEEVRMNLTEARQYKTGRGTPFSSLEIVQLAKITGGEFRATAAEKLAAKIVLIDKASSLAIPEGWGWEKSLLIDCDTEELQKIVSSLDGEPMINSDEEALLIGARTLLDQ